MKKRILILPLLVAVVPLVVLIGPGGCGTKPRPSQNTAESQTAGPTQPIKPGGNQGSLQYGGLKRTFLLHVPASYDGHRKMPVLLALHGGSGTGQKMVDLTLGGFNALAERDGFIVVYPDGVGKGWNDGRETGVIRAQKENIDDVGFLSALVDHLRGELSIDQARVYATGISNGGIMSNRLGCELSTKLAAIAPVAGTMPKNLAGNCTPPNPVSVLVISNTDDPLVPWDGGAVHFGKTERGEVLSAQATVKFWAAQNHCSLSPTVVYEPDRDPRDGTRVRRETYSGCRNHSEVVLVAVEGGGHTWPQGLQYLPEMMVGKTSQDISANEVIWNFFKQHELAGQPSR